MDYHHQGGTKALTQVSLLCSVFSFKHFNQYLPRQLKGSNSLRGFFPPSESISFIYFVFIPRFILFLTLTKKKLTPFPHFHPLF